MHQQASGSVTQNFVRVSSTMPKLTKRKKNLMVQFQEDTWTDGRTDRRTKGRADPILLVQ